MGGLVLLAACSREPIRTYLAPSQRPSANPLAELFGQPQDAPASADQAPLKFTSPLPAGWTSDPTPHPMRLATVDIKNGTQQAQITITAFPGDVGGVLANINRWRGQMELPPVTSQEQQPLGKITLAGHPALLLDLAGAPAAGLPARRMIVAFGMINGQTYFIKLLGPDGLVGAQKKDFIAYVQGLKLAEVTHG